MTTGRSVALERGTPVTALREPSGNLEPARPPVVVAPAVSGRASTTADKTDPGEKTRPMLVAVPPRPSRHHRRRARRRLVREQILVVLVLLALLAVTVVLLCFEWLASGPVSSSTPTLLHLFGGSS